MKLKDKIKLPNYNLCEELLSAISHGLGCLLSIAALVLCTVFSAIHHNVYAVISSVIYGSCSIILFTMSTLYHSLKPNDAKRVFRVLDHDSIFLLIAGTYTPFALVALPKTLGWIVFGVNWLCAIIGITLNSINIQKYKKLSMVLYLVMGWMILFTIKSLVKSVDIPCIYLMLSGGFIYTIGTIFYVIGKKKKYMHSIFHFFVLAASILFFFAIFMYVI